MRILILLITLVLVCQIANADVYVTYDKSSKDIIDMSPRADVVLENNWTRIVLPGILTDYPLQYHPRYYQYKNERFVLNTKKLSDEEIAKEENTKRAAEMKLIDKKQKLIAMQELKKEGIKFDVVKEDDFK